MVFRMGRPDTEQEPGEDLLPDPHEGIQTIYAKMERMGFNKEEFTALMGSHTVGFAHENVSGWKGRWTQNPHVFDNTYYQEVLLGDKTKYLRTPVEVYLGEDPELRQICEKFA